MRITEATIRTRPTDAPTAAGSVTSPMNGQGNPKSRCLTVTAKKDDVDTYHAQTIGTVGDVEVMVDVEGDEFLAQLIHSDLVSRADEIKQIIDEDIPPEETEKPTLVNWEAYKKNELARQGGCSD